MLKDNEDYGARISKIYDTLMLKKNELERATVSRDKALEEQSQHTGMLKDIEASVAVVQSLATSLQNSVVRKIESIVQSALTATFPDCRFRMEFVSRRDKTEVDMSITDAEGNSQPILDGCGGGLKDIVSFALRVAVWSLDRGASSVIILDEPFKFLSRGMRDAGAKLLGTLSQDLGIQFIVVSHVDEIVENSDTVYRMVKGTDGVTRTMGA